MSLVDPRTLILMASLLGALMAFVLELLRRSIPEPVPGLREWGRGTWLAFGAGILFGLRGRVPDLLSVTLANATLSMVFLLHLAGTRRFFAATMPWIAWLAAPGADHLPATHWVQSAYTASYTVGILMITLGFALWASDSVRERFEHQAVHDPLTQVRNRRALQPLLDHELERSRRYGRPWSLLLMDFDHFKAVNDRFGHAAGDAVLRQFAHRAQAALRPNDAFARWGVRNSSRCCARPHSTTDLQAPAASSQPPPVWASPVCRRSP